MLGKTILYLEFWIGCSLLRGGHCIEIDGFHHLPTGCTANWTMGAGLSFSFLECASQCMAKYDVCHGFIFNVTNALCHNVLLETNIHCISGSRYPISLEGVYVRLGSVKNVQDDAFIGFPNLGLLLPTSVDTFVMTTPALGGSMAITVIGNLVYACNLAAQCSTWRIGSDTWETLGPSVEARSSARMFELGGQAYITGGHSGGVRKNTTEVYDPTSNTWSYAPSMNLSKAGQVTFALRNGTIGYVVGGDRSTPVEQLALGSSAWTFGPDFPFRLSGGMGLHLVLPNGTEGILVLAGTNVTRRVNTGFFMDFTTMAWQHVPEMDVPMNASAGIVHQEGDKLFVGASSVTDGAISTSSFTGIWRKDLNDLSQPWEDVADFGLTSGVFSRFFLGVKVFQIHITP